MQSKIIKVNPKKGLAIFEDAYGSYGFFEILDDIELCEGDEISGELDTLGGVVITKLSTGEELDIFIENSCVTLENALRACSL